MIPPLSMLLLNGLAIKAIFSWMKLPLFEDGKDGWQESMNRPKEN